MKAATLQARQQWLAVYYQLGSATLAARRCGIARSTLQRWIDRRESEGLQDRSRRPHHLARQQYDDELENLVLHIRQVHNYGKIRICTHPLVSATRYSRLGGYCWAHPDQARLPTS